jgi:hypothetical protein
VQHLANVDTTARAVPLAPLPVPVDVVALLLQLILEHQMIPLVRFGLSGLDFVKNILVSLRRGWFWGALGRNLVPWMAEFAGELC